MVNKFLKITGLGVVLWALGLIWPEMNRLLTPPVMAGAVLGLGAVVLAYLLSQLDGRQDDDGGPRRRKPVTPSPVQNLDSKNRHPATGV